MIAMTAVMLAMSIVRSIIMILGLIHPGFLALLTAIGAAVLGVIQTGVLVTALGMLARSRPRIV
jgi:hypothetical protein